jgi:hypothetical protein
VIITPEEDQELAESRLFGLKKRSEKTDLTDNREVEKIKLLHVYNKGDKSTGFVNG